jgi:RNA polymerase sigma-70 factor (ECF subfamily)
LTPGDSDVTSFGGGAAAPPPNDNGQMVSDFSAAFAEEWPRVVGAILRAFGSIDLAEESAQEAFARVAERIAAGERIDNIGAWATTVARRIAVDSLRHDAVVRSALPALADERDALEQLDNETRSNTDHAGPHPDTDDRLGLIFIACDPVLSAEQQIALALRIVCGVPTADIADFFGAQEATVAARLTRARKAIAQSGREFRWPDRDDRERRRDQVLTTIYGVYTLGHTAPAGSDLIDARLAGLAQTLARAVASEYPDDTEILGLLALIVLHEARVPARTTPDGMPLNLAEVDRSAWGKHRIMEGLDLAARALPGGGRFALQAGIAGLHCSAARWQDTDWAAIATLYHGLKRVWPAPVVMLGSIVAESHRGPAQLERAAHDLRRLREGALPDFRRRVSAALADVEERRGRPDDARLALSDAMDGERNAALLRYYERAATRLP